MSAYVVVPEHIKELAAFAVSKHCGGMAVDPRYLSYHVSKGLSDQLAAADGMVEIATIYAGVLYAENIRSVGTRYPDDTLDDMPGLVEKPAHIIMSLSDIRNRKVRNAVHILKMCNCLEYQSCEPPDWKQTDAYQLLLAIRDIAIQQLPGYDEAPWEYETINAHSQEGAR